MIDDLKKKIKEKEEKDLFNSLIKSGLDKIHKSIKNIPAPKESVEISNFPEQQNSIKVENLKDIKPKDEVKISNPEDFKVKEVEVKNPSWFSLKGIIGELKSLTKAVDKKETNLDRYTRKDKPLAVKLVSSRRGGGFYDAVSGGGGGNKGDGNSLLAKEAKQDDIIVAINNVSGLQRSTDLEGLGDVAIGVAEVEIVITGTPEYIRIRANTDNTGIIYIGKTGVLSDGSNDFVRLESGDELTMSYDDTINALYAISDVAAQNINVGILL